MTHNAQQLTHVFILDGLLSILKELDKKIGNAMRTHEITKTDTSIRNIMRCLDELQECAPTLMEIMVEESLIEQIHIYQQSLDTIPTIEYQLLGQLKKPTPEERYMYIALSPL